MDQRNDPLCARDLKDAYLDVAFKSDKQGGKVKYLSLINGSAEQSSETSTGRMRGNKYRKQ